MESLAGFFAEILLIFEDFRFWLKRRKQRQHERKHGLPKSTELYPSQKIYILVLVVIIPLVVISAALFFYDIGEKRTAQKLLEITQLLEHERKTSGQYPEQLEHMIRNNPLHKNIQFDYWNHEFFYERHPSMKSYILVSLGKDGALHTKDDIKNE